MTPGYSPRMVAAMCALLAMCILVIAWFMLPPSRSAPTAVPLLPTATAVPTATLMPIVTLGPVIPRRTPTP